MNILVTKTDADLFLAEFADWLVLSDGIKDANIRKASLYVQSKWESEAIDWADPLTIPVEVNEATAFYAYSTFKGILIGSPGEIPTGTGKVKIESSKAGSVSSYVEYFGSSAVGMANLHPLAYPDMLMETVCVRKGSSLTRC